jgi:hypothetical protein
MLIPLGILAGSGGEPLIPDYELIATATGTGSSGTITFSSIPQDYKQLQVRYTVQNSTAARDMLIRINGATGSVYAKHALTFNGSVASINQTSIYLDNALVSNSIANAVASGIVDILDYASSTKNTTIRALLGGVADQNHIFLASGLYNATTAVSTLAFISASGNFQTTSRFSLYGIRG